MASYTFEANVAAPVETVFDVLTDHRGYSKISSIRAVELEREGDPAPNGVGAIRVLKVVGPPLREEVVVSRAPRPHGRLVALSDWTGDRAGLISGPRASRSPLARRGR